MMIHKSCKMLRHRQKLRLLVHSICRFIEQAVQSVLNELIMKMIIFFNEKTM